MWAKATITLVNHQNLSKSFSRGIYIRTVCYITYLLLQPKHFLFYGNIDAIYNMLTTATLIG